MLTPKQAAFINRYVAPLAEVPMRVDGFASMRNRLAGLGTAEVVERTAKEGHAKDLVGKISAALMEWKGLHNAALTSIGTLKENIRKTYGTDTTIRSRVEAGLSRLDRAVASLSSELTDQLSALLAETDTAIQAHIARDTEMTARRFLDVTRTDPVLSAIDATVFLPGAAIIGPLSDKLLHIAETLQQVQFKPLT